MFYIAETAIIDLILFLWPWPWPWSDDPHIRT